MRPAERMPDLAGLSRAELTAVHERAGLLLDWQDTFFGEDLDIFYDPPVAVSSLLVGVDGERMAAGLGLLRSIAELVATACVRLNDADFNRLLSRESFEVLGEIRSVMLEKRVAGLGLDSASEGGSRGDDDPLFGGQFGPECEGMCGV